MPDVFDAAPKVELHLHLEGAIPHDTIWELIVDHPLRGNLADRAAFEARLVYRDFPHFIETWVWLTNFLDTLHSFEVAAEAVARSLVEQNIIYAEASVSPSDYARHGLDAPDVMLAARRGLARVPEAEVALLVDLVRDTGPRRAAVTLDAVSEVADEAGIVGISIGGSEHDHPPEPFAPVYRRAAARGLRLTAHAGEAAGPESVAGAIDHLGVERIGHGVRSVEDPELLDKLIARQIPMEVCPTSNLRTGVATSWSNHPVFTLLDAGANVTINSDDPTMFGSSVAGDLREVVTRSNANAESLTLAAAGAAFAPESTRRRLEHQISTWWSEHR